MKYIIEEYKKYSSIDVKRKLKNKRLRDIKKRLKILTVDKKY